MIWIRADANRITGSGHVMRCLAIAAALKRLGETVCFITADESAAALFQTKGQEYKVLNSDYRRPEGELEALETLVCGQASSFFLADSYFVTQAYLNRVREWVPVGYLDDKGAEEFLLDLLINYNIFADALYYKTEAGRKMLLGTEYAPLREEFTHVPYEVRRNAVRVLVTTGGSDRYNLAGQFLKKALADKRTAGLEYCVVSGVYNEYLGELQELAQHCSNVEICRNVSHMHKLMQESDMAVTAGGSTMYELSAVGVPFVCFSFVDNQEQIVEGFCRKGLTCFGGNYLTQGEDMLDQAVEGIALLASDMGMRQDFSRKLRSIVDGKGAMRIAQELKKAFCRNI